MHAMVGNRTGETHRLGDRVTVKLVEAAPVAGALRFELLSEGRMAARPQQRPSGQSRPASAGTNAEKALWYSAADDRPSPALLVRCACPAMPTGRPRMPPR